MLLRSLVSLSAFFYLCTTQGDAETTLTTVTLGGLSEKEKDFSTFGSKIYAELGHRLNIHFVIIDAPHQRTYKDMADGKLDGLAYRTRDIEAYPGFQALLRVPVALGSVDEAAYTLDATAPCLTSWDDLTQVSGTFTTVRGYVSSQQHLDTLKLRDRAILVDSVAQALRLLATGKVRYVIDVRGLVENKLQNGSHRSSIRFAGTVSRDGFFLYLAPRQAVLAEKARLAFLSMQKDSLTRSLFELPGPHLALPGCPEPKVLSSK
jgi:hypothetical protein